MLYIYQCPAAYFVSVILSAILLLGVSVILRHDLLVPHLVRIPPHLRVHIRLTSRRPQPATSDYRRQLYEMDLWVRPLIDVTGRCRRTDPEFFRFVCIFYTDCFVSLVLSLCTDNF